VVLRASNLARRYRSGADELLIFEDVNLEVRQGEMVAIIGESGSGKSTLLHLLSGLDRASAGDVYFDSGSGARPVAGMDEEALADFRNRQIGFVWQQHYLLPEFTALENVMMPLLIAGCAPAQARGQARQGLEQVGLGERLTHRAGELSGGEQQRVAMARALANRPRFLMADEPTGNLDERTGAALFDLLRRLHQQQGLTSIVVTHNALQAERCDRVLRLVEGQLHELHQSETMNETATDGSGSIQVNPYV
jgi:lipoprotein-releasing system ATP-binding protein